MSVSEQEKAPRIALFTTSLCGGGAERVMATLANEIAARGIAVDLVLVKAEGAYLPEISGDVRVVDLDSKRLLTALPGLVTYLCRERPQIILSFMNHANVVALLAAKASRTGIPVVISERNTTSFLLSKSGMKSFILRRLVHLTYPGSRAVIAPSNGVAKDLADLLKWQPQRIHVIHNPLAIEKVQELASQPLDHPWFLQDSVPVILGVGRLVPQKDFTVLIKAFHRVQMQRPARLMILGEGESRAELEALISSLGLDSKVSLPGFASNPFQYMRRSAVFVLSSRWEGFPNTLAEAMACGTPVISTNCPNGPSEILENGKWGKLVPVGDVAALAKAISDSLDSRGQSPQIRAKDFSLKKAVDTYLAILNGCTGNNAGNGDAKPDRTPSLRGD